MKERPSARSRILLADDHRATLAAVKSFLESTYNIVGAVGDGQSLVQAVEQLRPDVAVTDICMPGMDGLAAARRVRELGSNTRVVFLTVQGGPEYLQAAIDAGAIGYVLKYRLAIDLPLAIDAALAGLRFISPPLDDLYL
jgi:DNA-binding NarL/FixJ family response regulator